MNINNQHLRVTVVLGWTFCSVFVVERQQSSLEFCVARYSGGGGVGEKLHSERERAREFAAPEGRDASAMFVFDVVIRREFYLQATEARDKACSTISSTKGEWKLRN